MVDYDLDVGAELVEILHLFGGLRQQVLLPQGYIISPVLKSILISMRDGKLGDPMVSNLPSNYGYWE